MKRAARGVEVVAFAAVLLMPAGCASGRSWHGGGLEVGMMGAMVIGGALFGTGVMHGRSRSAVPDTAFVVERYVPEQLLSLVVELELSDSQVTHLEALQADVAAERRTRDDAARAAYALLRPIQRVAAASARTTAHGGHRDN